MLQNSHVNDRLGFALSENYERGERKNDVDNEKRKRAFDGGRLLEITSAALHVLGEQHDAHQYVEDGNRHNSDLVQIQKRMVCGM